MTSSVHAVSPFSIRLAQPHELPHAAEIDDATAVLFARAGLTIELADDHPFVLAERARWREACARASLYWALIDNSPIGFHALGERDGLAYLQQLSVRPKHGRRGIGRVLLEHAWATCRMRGASALWLTTYDHLPWNAPFYERAGFARVAEQACGPELRATLAEERAALPDPRHRVAMMRDSSGGRMR